MAIATGIASDLDNDFANVAQQWPALFALCDDAAMFGARAEGVSGWGVAQQAYHCGLALARIGGGIENLLANPTQGAGLGFTHPQAGALLAGGALPRGIAKSPEFLIPPAAPTPDETRTLLKGAKAKWEALEKRRAEIPTCAATFPHPMLGNFTSAQWVRFIALHTGHHLKIVRDILGASGLAVPYDKNIDHMK